MDAAALLVFVAAGTLTHGASAGAFVRDLLCFELAWLVLARLPFPLRWVLAVTLAVGARAVLVGHFSVVFYLVALAFTGALLALGRTVSAWRRSS